MTKKKLITWAVKAQWREIVEQCVHLLLTEEPRTDNVGKRNKIRVKFPVTYRPPVPWPKPLKIPCEEEGYVIWEWPCWRLLDWMHKWEISKLSSKDVYTKRRGVMKMIDNMMKELDV